MFNVKDLKNIDKDDMLNLLGLETRRGPADWMLPTLGAFSVGLLVGAGLGLLMAPKPGAELRTDLRNRLQGGPSPEPLPATGAQAPQQGMARGA